MRVVIAGGGRTGAALAEELLKGKNEVVIIEKDDRRSEEVAGRMDALVLHGDASDEDMLKDADSAGADVVVAATGDDRTNLAVCELAKALGARRYVARVNEDVNSQLFIKAGAAAVNVDTLVASAFMEALKEKEEPQPVHAHNRPAVLEVMVPDKSRMIGKKLADIGHGAIVYSIKRSGENAEPKPALKVKAGDVLVICAPHENEKKIKAMF